MKFLDIGRKKFPQEPEFHVTRGQMEMRRGPAVCNRRLARKCFEMAIETTKNSHHAKAKEIQQLASQRLRLLGRNGGGGRRTPRSPVEDDFCGPAAGVPERPWSKEGPYGNSRAHLSPRNGRDPEEELTAIIEKLRSGDRR